MIIFKIELQIVLKMSLIKNILFLAENRFDDNGLGSFSRKQNLRKDEFIL